MIYELVIIGAGLAGLTVASHAQKQGLQNVLVIEHEKEIGGSTRSYWNHHEFKREKRFFQQLQQMIPFAFPVLTQTTVTGLSVHSDGDHHALYIQNKQGFKQVLAKKVVVATGALEKPREAHRIAGSRPSGVMSPHLVSQLLQRGYVPGKQILIVDNGRITRSVTATLQEHLLDVSMLQADQIEVLEIQGHARVEAVKVRISGESDSKIIPCDTFIYSKDRIPCTFFLKGSDCKRNVNGEICIDSLGQTNIERIYAVGACSAQGDDQHLRSIDQAETVISTILSEKGE